MQNIKMSLKIREQQPKTILYTLHMVISKSDGNTNQKTIMDTHIKKKKQSKHNTKDSQQITREDNKRRRKEK